MLIKQKYSWQHLSNSSRILRQIFRSQPISCSEIAEALGCPSSLVTSVTASLIEQGIIQKLGKAEKTEDNMPGRRHLVLGICPDARYSIGVEIGIRHFRFYITNLSGPWSMKNIYLIAATAQKISPCSMQKPEFSALLSVQESSVKAAIHLASSDIPL